MSRTYDPTTDKLRAKRENVTVWLSPSDSYATRPQMFWCPYCRSPILQYKNQEIVQIVAGESPAEKEVEMVMCSNRDCRRVYHFVSTTRYETD